MRMQTVLETSNAIRMQLSKNHGVTKGGLTRPPSPKSLPAPTGVAAAAPVFGAEEVAVPDVLAPALQLKQVCQNDMHTATTMQAVHICTALKDPVNRACHITSLQHLVLCL